MITCANTDHEDFMVEATVKIIDPYGSTVRCTYCAEGWMTALVRQGLAFSVEPI